VVARYGISDVALSKVAPLFEGQLGRPRRHGLIPVDVWTGSGLTRFGVFFIIDLLAQCVENAGVAPEPAVGWRQPFCVTTYGSIPARSTFPTWPVSLVFGPW
jgi:hypothetical protein